VKVAEEARRAAEGGPQKRRATLQKSRPPRSQAAPQKVKAAEDTRHAAEVKAAEDTRRAAEASGAEEGTKRRRNPARQKAGGNGCATVGQGR
jgi:hypothetical protein